MSTSTNLQTFATFVRTQLGGVSAMDPLDRRIPEILSGVWDEAKKMEAAEIQITEAQVIAWLAARQPRFPSHSAGVTRPCKSRS